MDNEQTGTVEVTVTPRGARKAIQLLSAGRSGMTREDKVVSLAMIAQIAYSASEAISATEEEPLPFVITVPVWLGKILSTNGAMDKVSVAIVIQGEHPDDHASDSNPDSPDSI